MRRLRPILILLSLLVSPAAGRSAEAVPKLINYQGKLTDETGSPLASGQYALQFRIWDDPLASDANHLIWGQEYGVAVLQGLFNVILGAPGGKVIQNATVSDLALAFNNPNRYIGITIAKNAAGAVISNPKEILPRQQILSTPYALVSESVKDGSVTFQKRALRPSLTNVVDIGGVAVSTNIDFKFKLQGPGDAGGPGSVAGVTYVDVPNMTVTLRTGGAPVRVMMAPTPVAPIGRELVSNNSYIVNRGSDDPNAPVTSLYIYMTVIVDESYSLGVNTAQIAFTPVGQYLIMPASAFQFIDFPPPGQHTYKVRFRNFGDGTIEFHNVRLIAYEL